MCSLALPVILTEPVWKKRKERREKGERRKKEEEIREGRERKEKGKGEKKNHFCIRSAQDCGLLFTSITKLNRKEEKKKKKYLSDITVKT